MKDNNQQIKPTAQDIAQAVADAFAVALQDMEDTSYNIILRTINEKLAQYEMAIFRDVFVDFHVIEVKRG